MRKGFVVVSMLCLVLAVSLPAAGQDPPQSPKKTVATQVGPGYNSWVTVDYSGPILRGRSGIFGEGEGYGSKVKAGAPLWRAGADVTTRIKSDVALKFGESIIPAGEHSLFIDLKSPTEWTLVISSQPAMAAFDRAKLETATWGAYGFDEKQVVARVPMAVQPVEPVIDQVTWMFTDVSEEGGMLAVAWDQTVANAAFTVAD